MAFMDVRKGSFVGERSYCSACNDEIIWTGNYWEHVNSLPRHGGVPVPEEVKFQMDRLNVVTKE